MEPWVPPAWTNEDAGAIQALIRGEAQPHQQQRAIKYIVEALCGAYDLSFRPSGDRDTTFAEGRRFVGLQIVKLSKINVAAMRNTNG